MNRSGEMTTPAGAGDHVAQRPVSGMTTTVVNIDSAAAAAGNNRYVVVVLVDIFSTSLCRCITKL